MSERARFEAEMVPLMGHVHRLGLRLTRRAEDAADLVQETMLRAYRGFHGFVPGTNRRAWLLKIAYSAFVDRWHQNRREPALLADDELEHRFEEAVGKEDSDQMLAAVADGGGWGTGAEVDGALRQLPEPFRSAVVLVDVEDLTYEEAATVLGCPVGTLRSRLFRGRKQLFVLLETYARDRGLLKRELP
jgi:RNA polymerase sigma-70 factor (ECF subfamily)